MRAIIPYFLIFCLSVSIVACSRPKTESKQQILTLKKETLSNQLFYSGSIQPIRTLVVPSQVDGVVVEMPFEYGQEIKKGNLLFLISSSKFLTDYKAALMQYVKAKNEFTTANTQLVEAKFLFKNELISNDDFKMKKSSYYAAQLSLLQAKDTLQVLLRELDVKNANLYQLTIADIDKITQALHLRQDAENIRVIAPGRGVVLSANKSEEETKKLSKGDVIKQGDVLALIGDMSGISVRIKVNELTVNQLYIGQPVKVTGIAFPDDVLQGEVKRVDRQGESSNSGLPMFLVEVIVPSLTAKQQNEIHVGMSAKVEISVDEEARISVPLRAIQDSDGGSFLTLYNEKTKQKHKVAVKTGKTTADAVAILSGVKPGDKIVFTD